VILSPGLHLHSFHERRLAVVVGDSVVAEAGGEVALEGGVVLSRAQMLPQVALG